MTQQAPDLRGVLRETLRIIEEAATSDDVRERAILYAQSLDAIKRSVSRALAPIEAFGGDVKQAPSRSDESGISS